MNPRLSIIIPSWERPGRTRRAINSVLDQCVPDWELLVVGDCCPIVQQIAGEFPDKRIRFHNMPEHEGAYGTQCLNWGIDHAKSPYVCFLGNDDQLTSEHVKARLSSIEGTDYGFTYSNAVIHPDGYRNSVLRFGGVGGSEITVKTDLARKVKFTDQRYGHDWTFIVGLLATGAKVGQDASATYVVMGTMGNREKGID